LLLQSGQREEMRRVRKREERRKKGRERRRG
jgi:hypothetical protein